MATPFPFTTGQVLTAAQMNSITELVINDKTDSYTLVAGDAGEYVVMNKATSSTLTVPNSVFTAGQIVRIINKGAGVCTVTAGAGTTVSTTGTLALAQNATGTLIALSASAFIFEAGGVTQSAGGLVYITGATFTTATSVSLPANTFSSTYRNYKLILNVTAVTSDATFTIRMRASGSDDTNNSYATMLSGYTNTNTTSNIGTDGTSWNAGESDASLVRYSFVADVLQPQIATATNLAATYAFVNQAQSAVVMRTGVLQFANTTQFDSLSFISSVASSITGTYRVYGYADS